MRTECKKQNDNTLQQEKDEYNSEKQVNVIIQPYYD